jgi:hypothetical protein
MLLLSKFEHAVAGGPAVTGFPAVAGVLAVESLLILAFLFYLVSLHTGLYNETYLTIGLSDYSYRNVIFS